MASEKTQAKTGRFSLRRHRLRSADFRRVYAQGSRARGPSMTVVLLPNDLGHARLGLSVGKRCWKSAVRRNRVRRVFREAFRLSRDELPPGVDLVLIASTPGLEPRLEPVREELLRLARRAADRARERCGQVAAPARAAEASGDGKPGTAARPS